MSRKHKILLVSILALSVSLLRLVDHIDNFTPVIAIALFSGAILRSWWAYVVPFISIALSDVLLQWQAGIGFYPDQGFVYGSYALIVLLSGALLKNRSSKPLSIMGGALGAPTLFYLVTNFGSWLMYDMYAASFSGLIQSYVAAIPFYRANILSTLIYVPVLFGAYHVIVHKMGTLQKVSSQH